MPLGSRPRKDLPLTRLLPNMLTLLAICSGMTAMRFALQEKWHETVLAIIFAAVFDVLDGRVARLLNIASKFGAELDSLSDAISFGIVPAFVMYEWTMKSDPRLGWIAVMAFTICSVLRLARFNTMLDEAAPEWTKRYFTGVPTPAGAGLALLPLVFSLQFGDDAQLPPSAVSLWLIFLGGLMVSRLPTLSLKGWRVKPVWVAPIFVAIALLTAALITNTWLALSASGVLYMVSLPLGWYTYARQAKRESQGANA